MAEDGSEINAAESKFVLAAHPKFSCKISSPLDNGEAMRALYRAVEAFMTDNALACLACMSALVMGSAYEQIIDVCGQIGVPFLYGYFGSANP